MNLREYLFYNKITIGDFSKQCGVSYTCIQNIKNGDCYPREKLALKIIELSGGKVSMSDLTNPNERKKKRKAA